MFTFCKNCVHRFVCAPLSSDEKQIVHLSMVVKSGKNRRTCYKHIDVLLVTVQKHLPCLTRNSATSRFRKGGINFDIVMYLQTDFVHVYWKRHELFQTMIGMCRFNITKIIIWYNICITIPYLFFHKYLGFKNASLYRRLNRFADPICIP